MVSKTNWRKDTKKVGVNIKVSGKEVGCFDTYLVFGSSCDKCLKNYSPDKIKDCPECKIDRAKELKTIKSVLDNISNEYFKKTTKPIRLSKKEKQFLKIIMGAPKDCNLYEKAVIKIGTTQGLTTKQAKEAIRKFSELGKILMLSNGNKEQMQLKPIKNSFNSKNSSTNEFFE